MVDLGFLLISFFVITTEMSRPKALHLNMPKGENPTTKLGEPNALTVLLDKNNVIYYYHGNWEDAVKSNQIYKTSLTAPAEIRKVIREKQQRLDIVNKKEGRKGLMLLIKPGEEASYATIIDMLDEALIHNIEKYAVLKLAQAEKEYLESPKTN